MQPEIAENGEKDYGETGHDPGGPTRQFAETQGEAQTRRPGIESLAVKQGSK